MISPRLARPFGLLATSGLLLTALAVAFGLGATAGLAVLMTERAEWKRLEGELVGIRNHQRHLWENYQWLRTRWQQEELGRGLGEDLRVPRKAKAGM